MTSKTLKKVILALFILTLMAEIPSISGFNIFRLSKTIRKTDVLIKQVPGKCLNSKEIYPQNETKIDCFPDENAARLFHIMAGKDQIGFSWHLPKTLPVEQTTPVGHDLIVSNPMPRHSGSFTCSSKVALEADPRRKTFGKHVLFVESPILTSIGTYSIHLERCGVEPQAIEEISTQFRKIICNGIEGCTRAVTSSCAGYNLMLDVRGMEFKMHASITCDAMCMLNKTKMLVQEDILLMRKKIAESNLSQKLQVTKEISTTTTCSPGSVLAQNRCLPCPPGSFTLRGKACLLCPPGHWENTYGSTQCKICTRDKMAYAGATSPEECSSTFTGQPKFTPTSCSYYQNDHLLPNFFIGVKEEEDVKTSVFNTK